MSKKNKPIEKSSNIRPLVLPTLTYSLLLKQRLKIEIELFKLFPNGEYVYLRTIDILNHELFNTSWKKSSTYLDSQYFLMDNFYRELLHYTNMHNIVIDDKVYRNAFFDYFGKKFTANSEDSYKKILTKFFKVQTKKFFQYNPHLKTDSYLGKSYFDQISKILDVISANNIESVKNQLRKERRNLPRKEYDIDMLAYYNSLRKRGMKRISAADETFKAFYSAVEIKRFEDYTSKIDSFIRSASKIKF